MAPRQYPGYTLQDFWCRDIEPEACASDLGLPLDEVKAQYREHEEAMAAFFALEAQNRSVP